MSEKEIKGKVTAEGLEEAIHSLLELRNKLVVATGMIKLRNKIYKEDDDRNPEFLLAQLVMQDINLIFEELGLDVPGTDLDELQDEVPTKSTKPKQSLTELKELIYQSGYTLTEWIDEQSEDPN